MAKKKEVRLASGRSPYAKKSLGQNFLVDEGIVLRIIRALGLSPQDTVLEIGPGRGALTDHLAESGAQVVAIELDRNLAASLEDRYRDKGNVTVIEADALEFDLRSVSGGGKLKLVANLPYYISTPILRRLFAERDMFSSLTVMVQKEVADRILAGPAESERGFLTVLLERGFECERLFTVPPGSFRPVPKVTSAVIRLVPVKEKMADGPDDHDFEKLVSTAFRQKRKMLRNNLNTAPAELRSLIDEKGGVEKVMLAARVAPTSRAESLTRDEWASLAEIIFN